MDKGVKQKPKELIWKNVLNRKIYPAWFFTNERINYFLSEIENYKEIEKIFSIGGGGDFVFSLLASNALEKIKEVNICDIREIACFTIELKIALFKNLKYEEFLNLFLRKKFFSSEEIYEKIKELITPLSKKIFESIFFKNYKKIDFLTCLKKSGLWYKDSLWQIKDRKKYLPYLISKESYLLLKGNLNKIKIYYGDFKENLKLFPKNYFHLIYLSNILDSKVYCSNPLFYLETIKEKLKKEGLLFITTQNNPKKMIKLIKKEFFLLSSKIYRFNIISLIFGHYDYSFLLFKKS